jgi:hypothetical protein
MAMGIGILSRLEAKGLLTSQEVDEVLEGILSGLEDFLPPTDPGARSARALVDAIAGIVAFRRARNPQHLAKDHPFSEVIRHVQITPSVGSTDTYVAGDSVFSAA